MEIRTKNNSYEKQGDGYPSISSQVCDIPHRRVRAIKALLFIFMIDTPFGVTQQAEPQN